MYTENKHNFSKVTEQVQVLSQSQKDIIDLINKNSKDYYEKNKVMNSK